MAGAGMRLEGEGERGAGRVGCKVGRRKAQYM